MKLTNDGSDAFDYWVRMYHENHVAFTRMALTAPSYADRIVRYITANKVQS